VSGGAGYRAAMSLEQQVTDLIEEGLPGDALVLVARELDAVRREVTLRDPAEMSPADRAALLWRVKAILDEMGDGSE
jgi:hypothetical protein